MAELVLNDKEKIQYEGNITFDNKKDINITITNERILLEKLTGFFQKKYKLIATILLKNIKTLKNKILVTQENQNVKIETLDINLPLYYGDKLSILKNGVGQSSDAYFPGEGGSIICMAHNTKAFLYNLPNIVIGSQIEVQTTYGLFTYEVYQTKIVNMYNPEELPIQDQEEIFMLYTCYPVTGLGHKEDRFVVYAKRVS